MAGSERTGLGRGCRKFFGRDIGSRAAKPSQQALRAEFPYRLLSLFLAFALFYSSTSLAVNTSAVSFFGFLQQAFRGRPGPYSDVPRPVFKGSNPKREPVSRGLWSAKNLLDLENGKRKAKPPLEEAEPALSEGSPDLEFQGPPGHSTGVDPRAGGNLPWEGGYPSASGGSINTGNGNKLTRVPLVSWRDRGGMVVDFSLYHNAQTTYNDELGKGWTWSYDIYINESGNTATVHWGDGLSIPFTTSGGGGGGAGLLAFLPMNALWATLSPPPPAPEEEGGRGVEVSSPPHPVRSSPASPSTRRGNMLFDTTYTSPAGITDVLVKKTNNTWELTKRNGTVYRFTTAKFCHEIEDRNGNKITLTLNGSNYCTRVTGPSGRYIDISLSSNNFTGIEDDLGRDWTFTLNGGSDTLTSVTHPTVNSNSYTDAFTYDGSGRILTHTDRRAKVWTFTYNSSDGSIATEKTPLNHTTSYGYTSSATTITLPGSQTIVHNYSAAKLASIVDQGSYSESYTYNAGNALTQKVDRRGKTWAYGYDGNGDMTTLTNPLSKVWTFTYNGSHDLTSIEDPLDNVTSFTYDGDRNLTSVEDPLGRTTVYTYDAYGQVTSIENAEEELTELTWDSDGNLTEIEDPLNHAATIAYNGLGWATSVTDANGNTEEFAYDEWGRLELVTHEDTETVSIEYNANSQVTAVTNERGKTTSYSYDDSGRLTGTTNAKSESESYAYNSNGWRTSVTNGRSKTRTYTYTSRGEVYTLTLPDSSVETWTYNGNGQVSAYTNPLSQTINYSYDNASQQTGIDYPSGTDTSFSYDDAGRMTSMVDSTGTTSWTYNDGSEVTAFDPPQGLVEYTYDLAGRRITMDHDGVGVTDYAYDAAGRLTSLTNAYDEVTEFVYDDGNRLTRKDFHNGTYETTSYDVRNRVTQILLKNSSNSTLRTQAWTYDDTSNVATMTQGGVTTTFGYDDIDQLTSESRSGYSASYTYDANGNRASKTVGGVTQTYVNDDADKLTSITQGGNTVKSFSYDTAGRTTGVTVSGNTTTLAYDFEGRITTITYPNTSTNTFTYSGLDTRVSKVDSGGTKTFLRDGAGVTAPVLSDAAAVFTPSISERRSSTTTYFHNGFKNAESQTIANETVSATQTFDAFGLPDTSSGSWKGPFGYGGPYGYQSDADSGLMLLGHRYYDASTGRFLTRDPAKDGRNWYGYCRSNSLKFADPIGLFTLVVQGGAGFIAPGPTGSAGVELAFGTDSYAFAGEVGFGAGGGISAGPDFGLGIDWGPPPTTGFSEYQAIGISILAVTLELELDMNNTPIGFNVLFGPGEGAGSYWEPRYKYTAAADYDDAVPALQQAAQPFIDWFKGIPGGIRAEYMKCR